MLAANQLKVSGAGWDRRLGLVSERTGLVGFRTKDVMECKI